MTRFVLILLDVGICLSSFAAIIYSIRVAISLIFNGDNWAGIGLIATYVGPLCFAIARYLVLKGDAENKMKAEFNNA